MSTTLYYYEKQSVSVHFEKIHRYVEKYHAGLGASSMLARAEAVITCDSHLANVIRSVENPGSNPELAKQFNRASKIIRECVAAILEVQASQVSLPKALKIKDMTQKKSQRGAG